LLHAGADPSLAEERGQLPLAEAAATGDPEMCELLLRYGARPFAWIVERAGGASARAVLRDAVEEWRGQRARRRGQGDGHFRRGAFQEAVACYDAALSWCPAAAAGAAVQADPGEIAEASALHLSRAAASTLLGAFEEAHRDAMRAIALEPGSAKAHEIAAKCCFFLDRPSDAMALCDRPLAAALQRQPAQARAGAQFLFDGGAGDSERSALERTRATLEQQLEQIGDVDAFIAGALLEGDAFAAAPRELESMLAAVGDLIRALADVQRRSPWGQRLKLAKVQLFLLPQPGMWPSADARETLVAWSQDALQEVLALLGDMQTFGEERALVQWQARCLLRLRRRAEARQVLDRSTATRDEASVDLPGSRACDAMLRALQAAEDGMSSASEEMRSGRHASAAPICDAALLAAEPVLRDDWELHAKLLAMRALARLRSGRPEEAALDTDAALRLAPDSAEATFCRGLSSARTGRFAEAVRDLEMVARAAPPEWNEEAQAWLARARRWVRRPPQPDRYAELGVPRTASTEDATKAYKAAARRWHPDKNLGNEAEAGRRFRLVREAFEVLTDAARRAELDDDLLAADIGLQV